MIPDFPEFKKLELADKEEIESFTNRFPPYSDFNFVSMWSWDTKGDVRISRFGGNLVIRFDDYVTGEPFYSLIGDANINETVHTLIDIAKIFNITPELKLIPEEVAKLVDDPDLFVEEDRDNFDYICDISEISAFEGTKFRQKRNEVNSLMTAYPTMSAKELDLHDPETKKSIITLFHKWIEDKKSNGKDFEGQEEFAFNKLLLLADKYPLVGVGVYLGEQLVAFVICEMQNNEYVLGHASKSDSAIRGTNAFLMKSMAGILLTHGRKYFNYEQDLGLNNLRDGKTRFRPVFFLKKYKIKLR